MKLKKIECSQFAGIRDCQISLQDGLNLIYGENESGKSTLVNVLSRTLFQQAQLDGRKNKDFMQQYFPAAKKGGQTTGDFIDGKVTFETEQGLFTLSKEWGADPRCSLASPDGILRSHSSIDALLKEMLVYGEGVYNELLFSSQKNTDLSLRMILDASKKTDGKQELIEAVSQAFAQSDGISVDAIEEAIQAKLEALQGKHWDAQREMPVRKSGRWATGLGEILKAYYAYEDADQTVSQIERLEKEVDDSLKVYAFKEKQAVSAQEAFDSFHQFSAQLALKHERRKTIDRLNAELKNIKEVLLLWPQNEALLTKGKELQRQKRNCEIKELYQTVKKLTDELNELTKQLPESCPSDTELKEVKQAKNQCSFLENQLCGMNLNALFKMTDPYQMEVYSVRTGEKMEISQDSVSISEAVRIVVDGVMELKLVPANVHVSDIEAQLSERKEKIQGLLSSYQVHSVEELIDRYELFKTLSMNIEALQARIKMMLHEVSFEELEKEALLIEEDLKKENILSEIKKLCEVSNLDRWIMTKQTMMDSYMQQHGSLMELKAKAFDLESELNQAKELMDEIQNIPEAYQHVLDPEAHLRRLQNDLKEKQTEKEQALSVRTAALSRLETYTQTLASDPYEEKERCRRVLEETKSLLKHWKHIQEVFEKEKEKIHDNPMHDIAEKLLHYLSLITEGKVSSEFMDEKKLDLSIYSKDRLLDYDKLSEGTKETVSLAFRLAVLDHLFPQGNGLIVLDDPLCDMDEYRTKQACRLIQECAKRHQILFLTCKKEMLNHLNGNQICL